VNAKTLRVTVTYAAPGVEKLVDVTLAIPACVDDAIERSGIVQSCGLDRATLVPAIFGQPADPSTPLADGDRIELTRPLTVDPKRARVLRARSPSTKPKSRHSRRF
jgi:putative ubiquitin-RnfH superfamily antitoxin RatB of RatAB toxin-antitoxin module